jgi:hypothetical protein
MAYNFTNITATISFSKIRALGSFFSYPLTINCWFYPTYSGSGAGNLVELVENTASNFHQLRINYSTNTVQYGTGTPIFATSSASYTTNTWNMATAVGTSATSRTVYLNAANSGTQTTSRTITTPDRVCIGFARSGGSDTPTMEGYVAEVAIWNVTLTTDELTSLYKGTKADQIRPQNLKFYMPLVRNIYDETASTTGITYEFDPNPEVNHVRRYG